MANVTAKNAKQAGDILVWGPIGADTAVVYSYSCPVDSHKVVSAVRLQYNSAGTAAGGTPICPAHHATLTGEAATAV